MDVTKKHTLVGASDVIVKSSGQLPGENAVSNKPTLKSRLLEEFEKNPDNYYWKIEAFLDGAKAGLEESESLLRQLAQDAYNACVDKQELQMTWNSALRQMGYKLEGSANAIRTLAKSLEEK